MNTSRATTSLAKPSGGANPNSVLTKKAPPGYVAGLGRGATGFTTRSDIGPTTTATASDGSGGGRGATGRGQQAIGLRALRIGERGSGADDRGKSDDHGGDGAGQTERTENDGQFDQFLGNDAGMLGMTGEYDEDDREADAVWEQVDAHMDERRRERREARMKEEIERYRKENPKITEQFADLKRRLADVSEADWEAIPDIGDYTIKKQKRFESFTPPPDTLLAKAIAEKETVSHIDPNGIATPSGIRTVDLNSVGEGRGTVLSLKLDKMADSVTGQTVVDPKGYLTDLKGMKITSSAEISDIKKARLLLKSVIQTNPKHGPGWIAAARLEEVAGKVPVARQLIQRGVQECPGSEDVWLEAARLQTVDHAKSILARGVMSLPNSVKLWLQAARLEEDDSAKARVIRKALENVPTSVRLWKAAVDLASEEDARTLLSRAVECCPEHVELWLALAKLEDYKSARKVLNRARQAVPTDSQIWITAAKLEEANGNDSMVEKLIERGIRDLQRHSVIIDRDSWLKDAETAEKTNGLLTCRAIVKHTISIGIEEADRKRTWIADAEEARRRGSIETARAIFSHALTIFPQKKGIWIKAAELEKESGQFEALDTLLQKAVAMCPTAEVLWLMGAKERWMHGDVQGAREILHLAFVANADSVEIFLAAFKLEFENNELERARIILQRARDKVGDERVWMKSAIVEREAGDHSAELNLLREGIKTHPKSWKMILMLGQLFTRQSKLVNAKEVYALGLRECSDCLHIWIAAAKLDELSGNLSKARALMEQARYKNPKQDLLWIHAVRQELRAGNTKEAESLMAKALQDCPTSGILWSQYIRMAARPQRKSRSVDALKRCNNDASVVSSVAVLFWSERKLDKARTWFNRAIKLDPDDGDIWAAAYRFERAQGNNEGAESLKTSCIAADPRHGELWASTRKTVMNWHDTTGVLLEKVASVQQKEEAAAATAAAKGGAAIVPLMPPT